MSKQDRTYSRTAAELERKYNLGSQEKGGGGNPEQMSQFAQELSEQKRNLERHCGDTITHITESDRENLKEMSNEMSTIKNDMGNKVANTAEYYGDINLLLTSGFYRVGTNDNLPDTCQYGQMIVSRGLDTISQIAFSYYSGRVFVRSCNIIDGTPNWGNWVEFYSTQSPQPSEEWKLLAEQTGETGTITLPTTFKELHIVIGTDNYFYTFNVLADYLSSAEMYLRNGYRLSDSTYSDVYILVNKTAISGWTVRKESVVKEVSVKVYYK